MRNRTPANSQSYFSILLVCGLRAVYVLNKNLINNCLVESVLLASYKN